MKVEAGTARDLFPRSSRVLDRFLDFGKNASWPKMLPLALLYFFSTIPAMVVDLPGAVIKTARNMKNNR